LVRDSSTLTSLSLYLNGIDVQGSILLSDALMRNTSLTSLDLGANLLGSRGVFSLACMLQRNTTLTWLDIRGCDLGLSGEGDSKRNWCTLGLNRLCFEIAKPTCKLTHLLLSFNQLPPSHVSLLCEALPKSNLKVLEMKNCGINDTVSMCKVAKMVGKCPKLTHLDIGLNTLHTKTAKVLYTSLRRNTTLQFLGLFQCRIGPGITHIANLMPTNKSLRVVELGGNLLEAKQMSYLIAKTKNNYTLESTGQMVCRCLDCKKQKLANKNKYKWSVPRPLNTDANNALKSVQVTENPNQNHLIFLVRLKQFLHILDNFHQQRVDTKGSGDCLDRILQRNRRLKVKRRKLAFLSGFHKRLGQNSSIFNILGCSAIMEKGMLSEIFEYCGRQSQYHM